MARLAARAQFATGLVEDRRLRGEETASSKIGACAARKRWRS
jgi:hypothetical protein